MPSQGKKPEDRRPGYDPDLIGPGPRRQVTLGDKYEIGSGQVGAVGPGAHAHDVTWHRLWNERSDELGDLTKLAEELEQIRVALKRRAQTAEQDIAVGEVAQAEVTAKEGQGPRTLEHLSKAGTWPLEVAQSIGATVAAAAIRASLGIP